MVSAGIEYNITIKSTKVNNILKLRVPYIIYLIFTYLPQDILFPYLVHVSDSVFFPILSLPDFISCRVFVFWLVVVMVSCWFLVFYTGVIECDCCLLYTSRCV